MSSILYKARVVLIRLGKVLPFIVCALVLISYSESAFALLTSDFSEWNGYIIPNKPISWFIGSYFEYNVQMLVVLVIISIAIETCIYNKLTCAYLGVNLLEKSWFADHEYEVTIYIAVCVVNIIICAWLCWKGVRVFLK